METIQQKNIEKELKESYIDYSMSVIVGRALPDVKDGLKPVHRRVLFIMKELGLLHNKPFKKSAKVVGDTLAKLHPHGDMAVYDTMVRMAQDFSLRYKLIDGQGNWGCFTGDTKIKLSDGRDLSFNELIKEHKQGNKNYTYSMNSEGIIEVAEIKNPRLTKRNQKIIKIILDNGEEIKCTLDHKFMLRDGSYKEAQYLAPEDSLMPIYTKLSTLQESKKIALVGYQTVFQPKTNDWVAVHVMADNWNLQNRIYARKSGKVRHHVDFNKLNNNPENILRLPWAEHWKLHSKHASELHKNAEYRKKISAGRKRFWADENNRKKAAKMLSERNKENWQSQEYKQHMCQVLSEVNIEFIKKHPEVRKEQSRRLKELWKKEQYRKQMSFLKSEEMKKRWKCQDPSLRKFSSEESKKIWAKEGHREFISEQTKGLWQNEAYRKKMVEQSKALWKNDAYRMKYGKDHFSNMAKKSWENPQNKELHREITAKQWKDTEFRKKFVEGVLANYNKRIKQNPNLMHELAEKAKISLTKKWKDEKYKEKVIKSKILSYVNSLTKKYNNLNPEIYEKERTNNCIPRLEKAINYFEDFSDMIEQAKRYNHKILKLEILPLFEDVYDLTIEGTHNFALAAGIFVHNSIDGDGAASYRYTEARMSKIAEEMLEDIEKETVDFTPNFDASVEEPVVLPAKLPNLLINGSTGIAVGMATNIPPHNLREVCDAAAYIIDKPDVTSMELMQFIKGPDFPTAGIILGSNGIKSAYLTGKGHLRVRAKTHTEKKGNQESIIITEIPYQVNKAVMIEAIAEKVNEKIIEGISDIRDESDKNIRVVIELKKDANAEVVLNQLYKNSQMETTFGVTMLALHDNQPKVMNLKEVLQHYIDHRVDVVTRRTKYDLRKAEERAHILEGLKAALSNIDQVVAGIKASKNVEEAAAFLKNKYSLSDIQAKAILEMRLQKLTSLEQESIATEHTDLLRMIKEYNEILASQVRIFNIIKDEIGEIKQKYGDERRTEIIDVYEEIETEDLIPEEDVVVIATYSGYVKRMPIETYKQQKRGGQGIIGTETKDDEDAVEHIFTSSTHSTILCFTNTGKIFWLKGWQIPEASRYAKGKAIINLLNLAKEEKVRAMIPIKHFDEKHFLIMVTKQGLLKKTSLEEYSNPRKSGIIAINLRDNDELVQVRLTPGILKFIIGTAQGMAVKFDEKDVRPMGRNATGVRGVKLDKDDYVIGLEVALEIGDLLTLTKNGYGKRTKIPDYRLTRRGGKGVINIKTNDRNGHVAGIKTVMEKDEVLIISEKGVVIRVPASEISEIGRNTQGVRIMRLKEGDSVNAIARVITSAPK